MYISAFFGSLFFVGLKSWQQMNVVHRQYWWITPTSLFMAATEFYVVSLVAKNGYGPIVIAIGFGAGLGATGATWMHHWMMNFKRKADGK